MTAKPTVNFNYPPGATPLDADELASLIPGHLTTQGELNEWEQLKAPHKTVSRRWRQNNPSPFKGEAGRGMGEERPH